MALSNWDSASWGPDGKPADGVFRMQGKAELEIYKNWLYVHDPDAWVDEHEYCEPTIMGIQEGNLRYAGTNIVSSRHDNQDSCFVYAFRVTYSSGHARYTNFAGIGCYGYTSTCRYIGVSDETYAAFIEWLKEVCEDREWLELVVASGCKRFNQGDAFFVGADAATTEMGEQSETIMMGALNKTKEESE